MTAEIISTSKQKGTEQPYAEIRDILASARQRAYTAVNFAMVESYWLIGQSIVEYEQHGEARAEYGKSLLKELADRLSQEFGKGFDESNLRYIRLFYRNFPIRDTLRHELTWSHYRRLISVEDEAARQWYMNEAADGMWSTRQMDRQISTLYYERLLASRDKTPVIMEAKEKMKQSKPEMFIHDPFVLEFLNLKEYPALHESDIEQALITHLQQFLLELGRGFCFVARQKRMRYDDEDFYVDLVFYHSILKCHVLIDLKLGKLTHGDVGQMDSYIRMFDALYKNADDNPTLGIILCSQKSEAIVKYSVLNEGKQIFASRYKLYLPTEEEFKRMLDTINES
jgi:predicted nuclease of restriction endonuclease-like (RecB) superfamily